MTIAVRIEAKYQEFMTATRQLRDVFGGAMEGMRDELRAMSNEAKASMKGSETSMEQFANVVKGRFSGLNGAIAGVQTAWAQLAVVVGAAAFIGKAVSKTVELTVEAQKLGRALGTSATQASVINLALGDVYASTDDYLKLVKGLDGQLKGSEKTLQGYGIATRDQSGAFRDQNELVLEALETLRGFKEGTDRNIAAQQIFGKGVNVTSELLSLNADALEKAREKGESLGLVIGQQNVEDAGKFRAAMNDLQDIMDAVMNAIGAALLPVLADLGAWFSTHGPTAILAIKIAISAVMSLFYGLSFAAKVVWQVVVYAFKQMTDGVSAFGAVFGAIMRGDFEGAMAAGKAALSNYQSNIGELFDNIMADAEDTNKSLGDMWSPLVNGPPPTKDSGIEAPGTQQADTTKELSDTAAGAAARAEAAAEMKAKREAWALTMEKFKGEEQAAKGSLEVTLDVYQRMLEAAKQTWGDGSKEAQAAANKIADIQRKLLEQSQQLNDMRASSARNLARIEIDSAEATAEAQYQSGQMTALQLIDMKKDFTEQRYQLERQALMDEAAGNIERVLDHEQTLLAIQELDAQHRATRYELDLQADAERTAMQQNSQQILEQGFGNAMMAMINRTMTLKQAMKSMFTEILQAFIQMLVQWAAKQLAQYVLDRTMHKSNLLAKKAAEKMSAASTIAGSAAAAGAAGVASWAGAPWPVNIGAPAFGASMYAASAAFGAGLAAEKGFDIPAGMNPVTQLHQKEMVLPAEQADVIRGMAARPGQQQEAGNYTIVANDPASFMDFLRRNPASLAEGVRYASRRGHTAGTIKL